MGEAIRLIEDLSKANWSAISAVASVWVAFIASQALRVWKYQTRAQKQMQFMDELNDTVHEYIAAMGVPIQLLEYAKIGVRAHSENPKPGESKNAGAIAYINKYGATARKQLNEYLDKVRPVEGKMMALATKGQVLGFENYDRCYKACKMLAESYDQVAAFAAIIGDTALNWANPEVEKTLEAVVAVDEGVVRENLKNQNSVVLKFVKESYQKLLG